MSTTPIEVNGVDNIQLITNIPLGASITGAILSLDFRPTAAQPLSADPSSPIEGQFWENTTSHRLRAFNGTADQTLAYESDSLSVFASPTSDLDINSHKLLNVVDPTNPQDAATKNYVDTHGGGGGLTNPMTTLGDMIYGAVAGAPTRLVGSTSATPAFLGQTGTGTASAAPAWVGSVGTGSVVLQTSPTLVTPNIGVASGTSLALGSASFAVLTAKGSSGVTDDMWVGEAQASLATLAGSYLPASQVVFAQKNIALNSSGAKSFGLVNYLEDSDTTGSLNSLYGVVNATAGNRQFIIAVEGDAFSHTSGTVDTLAGFSGYAEQDGAGTAAILASVYAFPNVRTAGTVTLNAGIYVDNQSGVANNSSHNYEIYANGTLPFVVRADGYVGVGTATPSAMFNVSGGAIVGTKVLVTPSSGNLVINTSQGNVFKVNLNQNVTVSSIVSSLVGSTDGQTIDIIWVQDATGGRTVVMPANLFGAVAPNPAANSISTQSFTYETTTGGWYSEASLFTSTTPGTVPKSGGGTANFLRADGTWTAPGGSGGALVLLEQHTASGSAELDFTACLSSTYDDYLIEVVGLLPVTNSAVPILQFSTNGGSTYDTSAIYDWGQTNCALGGGSGANSGLNKTGITLFGDSAGVGIPNTANNALSATLKMVLASYPVVEGQGVSSYAGNTNRYSFVMGGVYRNTTTVNAFRVLFSTGNIASGTIRVYGITK